MPLPGGRGFSFDGLWGMMKKKREGEKMLYWFTIPTHLIFLLCVCVTIIIGEGIIIFVLVRKKSQKEYGQGNVADIVKKFEQFWGPFVTYVLATSIICLFIASIVDEDNISLSDMNNWVSIVLGLVALIVGIISLWLSFYNVDQAKRAQDEVQETVRKVRNETGWSIGDNGQWCYFINGERVRNVWRRSGNDRFFLGNEGYILKDRLIFEDGDKIYYVDHDGKMVTNEFKEINGKTYYFTEDGTAFMNGEFEKDGKRYYFENGILTKEENI